MATTLLSRRMLIGVLAAFGLLAIVILLSLGIGSDNAIGLAQVFAVLQGSGDNQARLTVLDLRVPRTIIGVLVGVALGSAGALLQAAARNPLAEPGLLGVSAGSATAVVVSIALGASLNNLQVGVAIFGALVGCTIALGVARMSGLGDDPIRLVLAGAALSSMLAAVSSVILLTDQRTADEVRFWTIGAIAGRNLSSITPAIPVLLVGLAVALLLARPLAALALGEKVASGLGQRPKLVRTGVMISVALLVGSATAMAGPIGFVGLVVPIAARAMVGPDIRRALILAVLLGPSFVLLADVLSRIVARPTETPLGVISALIGAPILVLIVRSQRLPAL